jgi:hypothetical protein
MARLDRFVKPKTVRIEISDNDWIEIKRELTVGEQRRIQTTGMKHMQGDEDETKPKIGIDMFKMSFATVVEYLVDWSLAEPSLNKDGKQIVDKDGNPEIVPVELTEDAIYNLDAATFDEIKDAIDAHEEQLEKEKKARSGKGKSGKT